MVSLYCTLPFTLSYYFYFYKGQNSFKDAQELSFSLSCRGILARYPLPLRVRHTPGRFKQRVAQTTLRETAILSDLHKKEDSQGLLQCQSQEGQLPFR